jgi:ABC-2 type transport system ATP-binding protein
MLSAHRLSKRFGDVTALCDVTLSVRAGEVVGLLGPNGAGKSTLMRILMDIIRPDEGSVMLDGQPLSHELLEQVAYLPEERGLYRKQRVLDVIVYLAELKGVARSEGKRRALRWLGELGLSHTAGFKVEQLSKGMSQKVELIAALVCEPKLLVLDEPFSGLDPVNLRLVRDVIRSRKAAGGGAILSTHQMNEVEGLCDRVVLIHRGRLVLDAPLDELRQRHGGTLSLEEIFVECVAGSERPGAPS